MVSIQYGGGPTIEQQRAFCNPRKGSHIPGYLGFIPQSKFEVGKTFGQESHDMAHKLPYYHGTHNVSVKHLYPEVGKSRDCDNRFLFQDEIPRHRLPIPTGDNKYTERMIPGYSGDIPQSKFSFGGTYRSLCDEAINEFITNYERNEDKQNDIKKMAAMFPKLRPICFDQRVKDHMNLWSDNLNKLSTLATDKRHQLEPPVPGYTGFVPRKDGTELGLGSRYHESSKDCLETFFDQNNLHFKTLEEPMRFTDNIYTVQNQKSLKVSSPSKPAYSRRIFIQDGMIPGYTGHLHGGKDVEGHTYGEASRTLQVSQHFFPCYGDYIKNIDLAA